MKLSPDEIGVGDACGHCGDKMHLCPTLVVCPLGLCMIRLYKPINDVACGHT